MQISIVSTYFIINNVCPYILKRTLVIRQIISTLSLSNLKSMNLLKFLFIFISIDYIPLLNTLSLLVPKNIIMLLLPL
jgi:hypothetical protein